MFPSSSQEAFLRPFPPPLGWYPHSIIIIPTEEEEEDLTTGLGVGIPKGELYKLPPAIRPENPSTT
jgi:hypothetical protein